MKKTFTLLAFLTVLFTSTSWSQCAPGEVALTMIITVDPWGEENYWELVPFGNGCGNGTLYSGANNSVGCAGTPPTVDNGYPDNSVQNVGPYCLTSGDSIDLIFIDSYGDGGPQFELYEDGSFAHYYVGGGSGNTWTFEVGNSGLPANDSPCGALEITVDGPEVLIDNTTAIAQSSEPRPSAGGCGTPGFWCENAVTNSVWAYFTASANQTYEVTTCNSGPGFDTQIALYRVGNCSDYTTFDLLQANDDTPVGCASANGYSSYSLISCLNEGELIYIQVDGWAGSLGAAGLTVRTVTQADQMNVLANDVQCPLNKGEQPTGSIIPTFSTSGLNFTASWTGPNGFSATSNYLYNIGPGTYYMELTDACGIQHDGTYTIGQPDLWMVSFNPIGPDCELSQNGSIDLTVNGATAPYTYNWGGPNNFVSDQQDISSLPYGTYQVTITDARGCQSPHAINLMPEDNFAFDLGNDTLICLGDNQVVFGPPGLTYLWQDGSVNQFYEIQTEQWGVGTNALILTAYTAEGCSYADSYIFEVADCSNVLESASKTSLQVYPNPIRVGTALYFDDFMQHVSVQLYDASGRLVWGASDLEGSVIPISAAFTPGLYTLRAQAGTFSWITRLVAE